MTDQEYFAHLAAALSAVTDCCAKFMAKNPNAKYKDPNGKEHSIGMAIDIARQHIKMLEGVANEGIEKEEEK